ncbi:putative uncharacterized protein DDB_G0282133 [Macrobrachium rosenbergii]|uniref:putative uncharacterized protein DDB_G0282133 n=1 Tax=Macrobrachium rosenbergii TaxID=79674 RepID=UPI0034D7BB2D
MDDNMEDGSESDINKSNEQFEINSRSKGKIANDRGNADVAIPIDDTTGVTSVDESRTNLVPNLNNETTTSANTSLSSRVKNRNTNSCASHGISANKVIDDDASLVTDACTGNGSADFDERSEINFLESGEAISDRTAEAVNSIVVSNATELTSVSELSINDENQSYVTNDQESPGKLNPSNSSESLTDHRLNKENLVRNRALHDTHSNKNNEDRSPEILNFVNNEVDSVRGDANNKTIKAKAKIAKAHQIRAS